MWFINLESFYRVLLAKQGRGILTNPSSLVSKVLKTIYYKDVSFMDAKLGNTSSLIWKNIGGARNLIKEGLRWMIENEDDINI